MEKWIIINKPYDNYAISNYGNVKNIKTNKIIKQFEDQDGYMKVSLWNNGKGKTFKIHRLVALYFIENENEEYIYVNHKDGNNKNNIITNLEWVMPSQNNYEAVKLNLVNNINVKITDNITNKSYIFDSITQCADFFNLDKRCLSRALRRNGNYKEFHIEKI